MKKILLALVGFLAFATPSFSQSIPGGAISVSGPSCAFTAAVGAGLCVQRDSNGNAFANNVLSNATATTSAAGTTVLTAASSRYQALTGSSTQTYQLPDATTLSIGPWFVFNNNSSGALTITNAGGSSQYVAPAGGFVQGGPTSISTANGAWDFHPLPPLTVTWGSGTTGLVMNSALTTSPSILAGASSGTSPSFIPQRGAPTYGYGGTGTTLDMVLAGVNAEKLATPASGVHGVLWGLPIFTGGDGTTTKPYLMLKPAGTTDVSTWSTSGTGLGMNLASGFAGNFLDFHVAGGTSVFSVFNSGAIVAAGSLSVSGGGVVARGGSNSAAAWTTSGRGIIQTAATWTDTSSSGTIAAEYINAFLAPTLAFSNATTVTNAYNTYFVDPVQGSNATLTNKWALGADSFRNNGLSLLTLTTDATRTTRTVCQDTTSNVLYFGSGAAGICLGTSTRRMKEEIRSLEKLALPSIVKLRPVSYYKKGDKLRARRDYWLIAEEVAKVLPECVAFSTKHEPNSIDQICIQTFMLKAMQEQQKQINALRVANDNLTKKVARLK